jgi:hypothetical protein
LSGFMELWQPLTLKTPSGFRVAGRRWLREQFLF